MEWNFNEEFKALKTQLEDAKAELKMDIPIAEDDSIQWERNKPGRPRAKIDKEQFELLMAAGLTQMQIAEKLHVTDKTLTRWMREQYSDRSYTTIRNLILGKYAVKLCNKKNEIL